MKLSLIQKIKELLYIETYFHMLHKIIIIDLFQVGSIGSTDVSDFFSFCTCACVSPSNFLTNTREYL